MVKPAAATALFAFTEISRQLPTSLEDVGGDRKVAKSCGILTNSCLECFTGTQLYWQPSVICKKKKPHLSCL